MIIYQGFDGPAGLLDEGGGVSRHAQSINSPPARCPMIYWRGVLAMHAVMPLKEVTRFINEGGDCVVFCK